MSESDFNPRRGLLIAQNDVSVLIEKGKGYGNSWKKRGGVDSYMMLARKWDRIENQVEGIYNFNIIEACTCEWDYPDGLLDDIRDLRRYLLLLEDEVHRRFNEDHIVHEDVTRDKDHPDVPEPAGPIRKDIEEGANRVPDTDTLQDPRWYSIQFEQTKETENGEATKDYVDQDKEA